MMTAAEVENACPRMLYQYDGAWFRQCLDAVGWVSGRASGLHLIQSDEVLAWLSVWS